MLRSDAWLRRALALGMTSSLVLAACGGNPASNAPTGGPPASGGTETVAPTEASKAGGRVWMLHAFEEFDTLDPQVMYTGEDLAFFGATIMRSLTSFQYTDDPAVANTVTGDLATDTGTPNADATQWKFTLRDGLTWEDGSELTCEDVKYGVSRTFANDVIAGGPTYAVQYLDIPANPITDEADPKSAFLAAYYGPYDGTGQELFDQAVVCNGKEITFNLKQPVADFNMTVTLGFSPVPAAKDTAAEYGMAPVSNGPYKVTEYTTGNGGHLVLERNENWNPESDPIRKAYPDSWEVQFGLDPRIIDQRLIGSEGDDAFGIMYGNVQPENLSAVFADPSTPNPEFEGRAYSDFDPYVRYLWIDIGEVSNVKHRQAMAAALDREAMITNSGGAFAGTVADGVIKPNLPTDYEPTGVWDGLLGGTVPPTGDPELAKRLIAESAEPMPEITYDYPQTPVRDQEAAIIIASLAEAGIKVRANPIPPGQYYGIVFNDDQANEFGWGSWGPDWPNASTVISPLFTPNGGWNLSRVTDTDWIQRVEAALQEGDRAAQAQMWQDLNTEAAENMFVIPTIFGLTQVIAGSKVQPGYQWAPYGSWPYGVMYVTE